MNILYSFPLRLGRSGIGMTAWNQMNSLTKTDVKVYLSAGSVEKKIPGSVFFLETLKILGMKIPISKIGIERAVLIHDKKTSRFLEHNSVKIDAVHCWPSGCLHTLNTAKRMGITTFLERPSSYTPQVIRTMSNECEKMDVVLDQKHYASAKQRKIELEEMEFGSADYLLCPSPYALKTHADGGIGTSKLLLHHYGYDPEQYSKPQHLIDKRDGPVRGLFVGECNPMKGIYYALAAWFESGLYRNGIFTICGKVIPEFKDKLIHWLNHPSVNHVGFVDNVEKYMIESDFLILPSLSEGSALVTYEARACGCCILVSESSGAYCEHNATGLVHETGNIEAICSHMKLFLDNPDLIAKIRRNSLEDIKKYTWDQAAKRLKSLYEQNHINLAG